MELNEMKNMWQKIDTALKQNRLLNENVMRKMIEERSKTALGKIMNWEYLNIVVSTLVLMFFLVMMHRVNNAPAMLTSYLLSLACLIGSLVSGLYNLKKMSGIDFSTHSITDVTERLQQFRLLVSKEKIWSFILGPVMIAAMIVVMFKWVHNIDILNHTNFYVHHVLIGSIAYVLCAYIIYKRLYFNNIRTIQQNLAEINSFKTE